MSRFIVPRLFLGKVRLGFFLRFAFRAVTDVALFRFRAPLPRSLLIIFCVESVTCFEIMSLVCAGGFSVISLIILVPVRNASRPRALSVSLPIDLAPLHRIGVSVLNRPPKILPRPCPAARKVEYCKLILYLRDHDLPVAGNTGQEGPLLLMTVGCDDVVYLYTSKM